MVPEQNSDYWLPTHFSFLGLSCPVKCISQNFVFKTNHSLLSAAKREKKKKKKEGTNKDTTDNTTTLLHQTPPHTKFKKRKKKICGFCGSNTVPPDLQSDALPGELKPQNNNL